MKDRAHAVRPYRHYSDETTKRKTPKGRLINVGAHNVRPAGSGLVLESLHDFQAITVGIMEETAPGTWNDRRTINDLLSLDAIRLKFGKRGVQIGHLKRKVCESDWLGLRH